MVEIKSQPFSPVAFNVDGTKLATASADRTARLWSVATGEQMSLFDVHEFRSIAFQVCWP